MASIESGVLALQTELEKARENLKGVDENIKKLTGRDPYDQRPAGNRRSSLEGSRGRGRTLTPGGRRFGEGDGQAARRLVGGAFSRLGISPRAAGRGRPRRTADSDEEEELPNKPTIQSSVILTPKEPKTRQDSLEEQKKDKKGNARNRRMFGLLLGTLQKFKDEAKESQDKEDQRKQIEHKLEEKAQEEKDEIIKERRQLFQERRQTQAKLRRIEQKIEIVETSQECQAERLKLVNFIRTKAKPHIFYLPRTLLEVHENKKKETATIINEIITQKQKLLEEEIENLMSGKQGHVEEEDHEDHAEGGEGEEEEGAKKGEEPEKENRITRHYRTKTDVQEDQEELSTKKRRKSSGDRRDRRKSSGDRDHERKHRKTDEHHRDVHHGESEKRRRSDHGDEGRHRRTSQGEGGRRERNGERRRSENEVRDSHKDDDGREERRRSHGESERGHEHDRDGKRKAKDVTKKLDKKEDGVKVAIDYDEQDEGGANEEPAKIPVITQMDVSTTDTTTHNMADIPMPDDVGPMPS